MNVPTLNLTREFYTREEFAELLQVSLRTVDEWIATCKVTHFKMGRNVRIPREAIAMFVLKSTVLARDGALPGATVINQAQVNVLMTVLAPVVEALLERRREVAAG